MEQPALGQNLPLDIRGSVFQVRVWEALRQIPPGSTASYTEIATRIGQPGAARAVAAACAANPLAVAIPCHRVVRNDEAPSVYRWGVERTAELRRRESVQVCRAGDLNLVSILGENVSMKTATDFEALADLEALCLGLGKPQDPELIKRVQERAREVRERVHREHGVLDVAVDLIRETRDE